MKYTNVNNGDRTDTDGLFEAASRLKLRFKSERGPITVEQLWDVPLRSNDKFNLNAVAKATSADLKELSVENFVDNTKTKEHVRLELALDIVKYVIETQLDEEEAVKTRAANKLEKEKLLKALAEKQDGKLSAMSEADLKKRIEALNV